MNQFQLIHKAICLVFLITPLLGISGCKNDPMVYQVNDVISDPSAYSGNLSLEGVVYAFAKENPSIVGVMDKKELQCTSTSCSKALIAVQITDAKLSVGDEVKVSGTLVKENWGYLMKANRVKVVANHKLGGA